MKESEDLSMNKENKLLDHNTNNTKNHSVTAKQLKCILASRESCKNKHFLKTLEILEIKETFLISDFKVTIGQSIAILKKKKKSTSLLE